jgi:hypothetical protein
VVVVDASVVVAVVIVVDAGANPAEEVPEVADLAAKLQKKKEKYLKFVASHQHNNSLKSA